MNLDKMEICSVKTAASILGCTAGRVRQLLLDATLKGEKLAETAWLVDRKSVEKYAKKPTGRGRPRKFA